MDQKHYEECMSIAKAYEQKGESIMAGIFRVEAHNDRKDWQPVPKPPLGKLRKLEE